MKPITWLFGSAGLVHLASAACGGETLRIGGEGGAPNSMGAGLTETCNAAPGNEVPEGKSIAERLPLAKELLVGRWFVCPGSPLPPDVTAVAIEFTHQEAYVLVDAGGDYERADEGSPYTSGWSLRNDALVIEPRPSSSDASSGALGSSQHVLSFEDAPLRMTWIDSGTRFVKR
jgi:hypothetical protein